MAYLSSCVRIIDEREHSGGFGLGNAADMLAAQALLAFGEQALALGSRRRSSFACRVSRPWGWISGRGLDAADGHRIGRREPLLAC